MPLLPLLLVQVSASAPHPQALEPPTSTTATSELNSISCGEYVFGFSNGHTGTTSLSSRDNYQDGINRSVSTVAFVFEIAKQYPPVDSVDEQATFVRETYLTRFAEEVAKQRAAGNLTANAAGQVTCVDLSHNNLMFFRGLQRVMHESGTPFRFVRIDRDIYEFGSSNEAATTSGSTILSWGEVKKLDGWGEAQLHPWMAPGSKILSIGKDTWNSLTPMQQRFWQADEAEAQWQTFAEQRNALKINWSKRDGADAFRRECAAPTAEYLGLQAAPSVDDLKQHAKEPESESLLSVAVAQLADYRSKMLAAVDGFGNMALPSATQVARVH